MREPRWLRPATRLLFILAVTVWVTVSVAELIRWIVADGLGPGCPAPKGAATDCPTGPPTWTLAIVGVLGVLSGWLAGRLTRPRVESGERSEPF